MDVPSLTDVRLREELIQRGQNPGPIAPTTRALYEKKLLKLLAAEASEVVPVVQIETVSSPMASEEVFEKVYPSLEAEEETVRQRRPQQQIEQDTVEEEDSDEEGQEFSRILSEEESRMAFSNKSLSSSMVHPKKQEHIGKLLLFLAMICGAVFLFFFADNISKLTAPANEDSI